MSLDLCHSDGSPVEWIPHRTVEQQRWCHTGHEVIRVVNSESVAKAVKVYALFPHSKKSHDLRSGQSLADVLVSHNMKPRKKKQASKQDSSKKTNICVLVGAEIHRSSHRTGLEFIAGVTSA